MYVDLHNVVGRKIRDRQWGGEKNHMTSIQATSHPLQGVGIYIFYDYIIIQYFIIYSKLIVNLICIEKI